MASLQELLAPKADLEEKIAEVQSGACAEAIAKIRATMAEFGLTVADPRQYQSVSRSE